MLGLVWLLACGGGGDEPTSASTPENPDTGYGTTSTGDTTSSDDTGPDLPGHDDCLPEGEQMSEKTCLAVIAYDDRFPGESFDKSGVPAIENDPRLQDEDIAWFTSEIQRCTCYCCHQSTLGGPGSFFWDLDYEGDVWLDSASAWSLQVLVGVRDSENQMLPTADIERARRVVEKELKRRDYED